MASAYLGSEGYLFLGNDSNRILDQISGRLRLSPAVKADWARSLQEREDFFRSIGMPLVNVILRNKEWHFKNFLPAGVFYAPETVIDDFISVIPSSSRSGFLVVDFASHCFGAPTFMRGDTHYTAHGAFCAYMQIVEQISKVTGKDLDPLQLDELTILNQEAVGDLSEKLDYPFKELRSSFQTGLEVYVTNGLNNIGFISYQRSSHPRNRGRLLIFGNSFAAGQLLQLLSATFSEVFFVFAPNVYYDLVKDLAPDLVLVQYLERFLVVPSMDRGVSVFDFSALKCSLSHSGLTYPAGAPMDAKYIFDPIRFLEKRIPQLRTLPTMEFDRVRSLVDEYTNRV